MKLNLPILQFCLLRSSKTGHRMLELEEVDIASATVAVRAEELRLAGLAYFLMMVVTRSGWNPCCLPPSLWIRESHNTMQFKHTWYEHLKLFKQNCLNRTGSCFTVKGNQERKHTPTPVYGLCSAFGSWSPHIMGSQILDSILKQTLSHVRNEFSSPHLLAHILHPPRPIPCFLPTWVYFLTWGSHTSPPSVVFSSSTAPCTPVFSSLQTVFSKSDTRSLSFPLSRCLSLSMIAFPLFYIARLHEEITYIYPMH